MPKYNSIDNIPAKIFFDILENKDYQQLKPKPKEKGLKEVFMKIYDDFFLLSDNYESKEYLRLMIELSILNLKYSSLMQILKYYHEAPYVSKTMITDLKGTLKKSFNIDLDENLPFLDELHRIVTIEAGIIKNDIVLVDAEFKRMIKDSKSKASNFYDELVSLGQILQGNNLIKEDVTLAVYVSLCKTAKKLNEQNKKIK